MRKKNKMIKNLYYYRAKTRKIRIIKRAISLEIYHINYLESIFIFKKNNKIKRAYFNGRSCFNKVYLIIFKINISAKKTISAI
jgi:hypothetical protein